MSRGEAERERESVCVGRRGEQAAAVATRPRAGRGRGHEEEGYGVNGRAAGSVCGPSRQLTSWCQFQSACVRVCICVWARRTHSRIIRSAYFFTQRGK